MQPNCHWNGQRWDFLENKQITWNAQNRHTKIKMSLLRFLTTSGTAKFPQVPLQWESWTFFWLVLTISGYWDSGKKFSIKLNSWFLQHLPSGIPILNIHNISFPGRNSRKSNRTFGIDTIAYCQPGNKPLLHSSKWVYSQFFPSLAG